MEVAKLRGVCTGRKNNEWLFLAACRPSPLQVSTEHLLRAGLSARPQGFTGDKAEMIPPNGTHSEKETQVNKERKRLANQDKETGTGLRGELPTRPVVLKVG